MTRDAEEPNKIPPLLLAYVGDAVFELAVRTRLVSGKQEKIDTIHRKAVSIVNAEAQARRLRAIEPCLREEELDVVRRGRNAHARSGPRNTAVGDYRRSTGLEALLGHLYLKGDQQRLEQILEWITGPAAGENDQGE